MDRRTLTRFKRAYGRKTDTELADEFKVSLAEVRRLGIEHALGKDKRVIPCEKMPRWTEAQVEKLVELYPNHSNEEIAAVLGRTAISVLCKANRMQLQKSSAHLAETGRENVSVRWEKNSP